VYTDNQPDFSYLAPYETKTFSQYWWPYQKIGPVQEANILAAIRCVVCDDQSIDLGLVVVRPMDRVRVLVKQGEAILLEETITVSPDQPWQNKALQFDGDDLEELCVWVFNDQGEALIGYRPVNTSKLRRERELATEPPLPDGIESVEELYLTGEHLELYRHPTRYPELYWEEALRREPLDARCNIGLGRQKMARGQFVEAAQHFENAIARLTFRHPNPETGEAHYYLGLCHRYLEDFEAAYSLFYKATWNYAWRAAAYYELACIDLMHGKTSDALKHYSESLETNATNNKALVGQSICLRKLGQTKAAQATLESLLSIDRLDHWALAEKAKLENGTAQLAQSSRCDAQTALDVAFDYADCGCWGEAIELLEAHLNTEVAPVNVPNPLERTLLTTYALAWFAEKSGDTKRALSMLENARAQAPDYCFPSRLHEMKVLEWASMQADRNAAYGLGNFYFDKKRHEDAIHAWEQAREADPEFATVHRNLGIAYWNARRDGVAARNSYQRALASDSADSRLVVEFAQLCEKLCDDAESRLAFFEAHIDLVLDRDDATVELAQLYNETVQPKKALQLLTSRRFHPWEGGEGKVLRQYTDARLKLGEIALGEGDPAEALNHFQLAYEPPNDLGEKYHLLQAKADLRYWQGKALRALEQEPEAILAFEEAANESGDFQGMEQIEFSELTLFKALSLRELGRESEAAEVLEAMATYAKAEMQVPAKIDYFATSLPDLLVFEEDLDIAKSKRLHKLLNLSQSKNS
ncbi:MAG TPA: DUF5107 domain-containing protein, partial [Opitutae bacterium]|nr:DUF5107 domain-containing protein [Opitutae bacterium]